uniref:hypothetical protein n=1 Tax=Goniotrichopsis reniformis TaxID=468933 RepID=UPI001FCDF5D7|nr:hypothetical protein MW428_pgp153 [Goniotrichopsis reniformis]UNJ14745.1 hypothetical protein [Goniotrichopsis reniformis]
MNNRSDWPIDQGKDLNYRVAKIFALLHIKIAQNLSNKSSHILPIDVLSNFKKHQLFLIILEELEKVLLDTIRAQIKPKDLTKNKNSLALSILSNSREIFFSQYNDSKNYDYYLLINYDQDLIFELENNLELLLLFSILGSSHNTQTLFNRNLPQKINERQIEVLFDNFLVQTSNLLTDGLLRTTEGISFSLQNHLFNSNYYSVRNIEQFRNNLMWHKFMRRYIIIPKNIYENRYNLYVLSPSGILTKYIFAQRLYELSKLSTTQLIITFIIEIQDFLLPKIYSFLRFITKIIFFVIYEPLKSNTRLFWHNLGKDI